MKVKIKRLYDSAKLPQYATEGAGAMDLFACVNRPEKIFPGQVQIIGTGIAVEVPFGYGLFISPRSGLYLKHGVFVATSPALIDNSQKGREIKIILKNEGVDPFYINPDAKIAECFICELPDVEWIEEKWERESNG